MQSDLSQLGGFARATVQQLTRAGFTFAGVENGVVRLTPPTGGQPLEFTNDAYVSATVAAPVRDDVSTDDSDFSQSLGGADFAPVYDSTTAADAPAIDAPEWDADADLEAALVEMYDADPADDETPDPAPILCQIADLGAGPFGGCPPPANFAGCEDDELAEAIAQAPACATTPEAATAAFVELGFDRATAEGMGAAAAAAGLNPTTIDLIATQLLDKAPEPPHADRMPRAITTHIQALVTRSYGARIAKVTLEAHHGEKVLKTRSVAHQLAPSVRVQIAEAAIVAEALRMLRGSADVYVLSTFDLSPEARPVIRGKRSVWDALDSAEKGHNVTWHCRRKDRQ